MVDSENSCSKAHTSTDTVESVHLKNRLLSDDLIICGILFLMLCTQLFNSPSKFIYVLWGLIFCYMAIGLIVNHKYKRIRIIIDNVGITDCKKKKRYVWDCIEYAYFVVKGNRSPDLMLYIKTDHSEALLDVSNLKFDQKRVLNAINQFSGRNINKEECQLVNDTDSLTTDQKTEETARIFQRFQAKWKFYSAIMVLGSLSGLAIAQTLISYHYLFAMGYALVIPLFCYVEWMTLKYFRRKSAHLDLNNEQFNELALSFRLKTPVLWYKYLVVFYLVSTLVISLISYHITHL